MGSKFGAIPTAAQEVSIDNSPLTNAGNLKTNV